MRRPEHCFAASIRSARTFVAEQALCGANEPQNQGFRREPQRVQATLRASLPTVAFAPSAGGIPPNPLRDSGTPPIRDTMVPH